MYIAKAVMIIRTKRRIVDWLTFICLSQMVKLGEENLYYLTRKEYERREALQAQIILDSNSKSMSDHQDTIEITIPPRR